MRDNREYVAWLCQQLVTHEPIDRRELESIEIFRQQAPLLTAPFDEHSNPTHITASVIIAGEPGVVLHLHKRLGIWVQPGGHIDPGESITDAAMREATEETGLHLSHFSDGRFIHLDVHPGPKGHTHLDVRFLLLAGNQVFAPAAGESQEVRWFGWDAALVIAEAGARGAISVARKILGLEIAE